MLDLLSYHQEMYGVRLAAIDKDILLRQMECCDNMIQGISLALEFMEFHQTLGFQKWWFIKEPEEANLLVEEEIPIVY